MATPQLGNCPKCKKLYLRVRNICDECYQKQEEDYLKTAAYLREYPGSTIQEVSDETKVSVTQIRQYILSGRILMGSFPNLSYPCEICGNMIRGGKACKSCLAQVNQISNQTSKEEKEHNPEKNNNAGGYITHYL
ncbi:flagellar protein [Neobacillus drentensis]|uniref:flagellar protein n=1 Tax=Neobacillus drentensis TaxID=220684 RepID=UPI002FFFC45B